MDFITLTQQQAALERALEESPDTGVLFLVPNLLGPGRLQDWLQTLPDSVFQIGSTVITSVSDTEFTVVGEALDTLPLPQYPTMSSSVASGTVTLTFSQATLGSDIAQAMDWDEVVWQLNQESYQGQASLTQPGLLHFDGLPHSPEGRSYGDWLSDFSGGAGNSHMTNGGPFLDSLTAQSIRCVWSFDTIAPTLPSLELQLSDPDDSLTLGPFSFTQAIIGTQIMLRTQEDGSVQCQDSNFVQMQVLMSDLEVEANLTISPAFNWQLTLTSRAGLTWSGVTEYLASTDYGAPLASIASALDNLPLSELTLNRVHLVVNPRALSVLSVTLLGTFQLFTGTIEYTLDLPSGNFYGALFGEKKIGQTVLYGGIPVQPILAEYFGQDNLFPATTVSTLTWSILPGTQTFTLNLGLDEVLRFHIGFTPVSIKRLDLNIRKSIAEDTLSGSFTGMFTLAEVIFYTEAVFRDDGDWDFIGKVDHGLISLVDFVQGVASFTGATLPSNVPETTIFDLEIGFSTAHQNFALKAKTDSTVVIPFLDIEESRIYVDIDMATGIDGETGLRVLRGKMIGQFEIAETATFLLSYEIAQKNHIFEASWQVPEGSEDYLSMHSFLRAMGIEELPVNVDGNDLELSSAYLRYEVATQTLTLVGETTAYGKAFLVATQKPPEGEITRKRWSYVVGWNYENVSSFSDIDGLPESWESADVFTLESAGAWFASEDMPGFQVPVVPPILTVSPPDPRPPVERLADLDEFDGSDTTPDPFNGNSPADLEGTVEPIGVNETIDLIQGFNVVANINLGDNPESKGEIDILNTLLPTGKLTVFAAVNLGQDTSFTLAALIPGSLTIPTGEESAMVISNAQLVFSYKAGALAFVLSGQIAMTLDNVTIVATARMLISLDLVLVSLFVEFGEDGWQQPMGIPSLILKKVGFQLGIAFAPVPRVRIGLEGTFEILDEPLPDTRTPMVVESREFTRDEVQLPPGNLVSFAFVLEIVQQFPVPMLLRFYVEEIPVGSVMQSFVRASSSTLPETIQNTNLRKVSFFMAQRRLQLPSGEWASPGFRFSGLINVLDFSAYAAMAVNPVQGITGELMLSPITIGNVLTLAGTSPGLFWEEENGAPKQAT
ncbi:MAG TPA: hypothetical protein DCE41_01305, partial [Cytophagales bacterium]|nr:hypothetical protein [Cytophagales bacterium]